VVKKPAATVVDSDRQVTHAAFQTVTRKQMKKIVYGNQKENSTFSGVMKKAVICINRLDPSVTPDTMVSLLKNNDILVHSRFKVDGAKSSVANDSSAASDSVSVINARGYSMMRVCVSQLDLPKILSEDLWPDGVTVRVYGFFMSHGCNCKLYLCIMAELHFIFCIP